MDLVRDKYLLRKLLGKGKFGQVFQAVDTISGEYVAIKREPRNALYTSIKHEVKIMSYLYQNNAKKHKKTLYIPLVYWYGLENGYIYLVMTHFDIPLLEFLHQSNNYDFHKMFIHCISILETVHELFVIHRDIKPENFMVRDNGKIYLIDFGLATFYLDGNGVHIPNHQQSENEITGTPKYVSYYNHMGNTISRRDDLISLGYMFILFQTGHLPWEGGNDIVRKTKKSWDFLKQVLCRSSWLYHYLDYCYQLDYDEEPWYSAFTELDSQV